MDNVVVVTQDPFQRAPLEAWLAGLLGDHGRERSEPAVQRMNAKPRHFLPGFVGITPVEVKRIPAINDVYFVSQAGQVLANGLCNDGITAIMVRGIECCDVTKTHAPGDSESARKAL